MNEPTLDVFQGRGFLKAALYHHKTSQKKRTKVIRLLPVARLIPGVSGCEWAQSWLDKRAVLGLKTSMQPTMGGEEDLPSSC